RNADEAGDPYRVALIDDALAGIEGAGLARRLRSVARGTRIVLMGQSATFCSPEGAEHGDCGRLSKPVRRRPLLDCLACAAGGPPRNQAAIELTTIPEPPPSPARILLAEDNLINQKVALGLLARLGLAADVVPDGAAALAAMERMPYDLILMDCQMPVMDG